MGVYITWTCFPDVLLLIPNTNYFHRQTDRHIEHMLFFLGPPKYAGIHYLTKYHLKLGECQTNHLRRIFLLVNVGKKSEKKIQTKKKKNKQQVIC